MTRLLSLVLVALALGVAPPCAHAQWWKQKAESRLDQRIVDPTGATAARLKWDDGYVEVKAGATADRAIALNRAHERGLALDAARQLAYFKLAEIVEGVAIDGVTVVKNAMVVDQTVRSTVQARIRGAVVVSENVDVQTDGSVWAEVVMGLRLRGAGSVTDSVAGWAAARPADPFRGDPGFRVNEPYTGLIIDASEATFSPALAPRVLPEGSDKIVFGPHLVQPSALSRQGPVGYAPAMSDARQTGRAGANPLIVRALPPSGTVKGGDLRLLARDAERVLAANASGHFLENGAVIVVLGREPAEVRAQGGKRHALLIGVEDYGAAGYPKLNSPVRDVRALAQTLRTTGGFAADAVTVLENPTRDEAIAALRALRTRVRDEDAVIVFFSGHGAVGPGADGRPHYYLVPRDGRPADLPGSALTDDRLEELIGQIPASQVVVLLDACYSGGGTGVIRARAVPASAGSGPMPTRVPIEATAGRVVLSASRPDQPAYEDDQRGGLFTSFVVEGLRGAADADRDGTVTVLELYQFVSPRVREYTRRNYQVEQSPVLEVRGLSGEIVMAARP
jgi:hypothetical protein